jgi:hypothetical protein
MVERSDNGTCTHDGVCRRESTWLGSSSRRFKNIPVSIRPKSPAYPCHPVPNEGRFAIVTNVRRDAVDAEALLTNSAKADGEVVWF